jgi:DNA repair protein RadC
VRERGASEAYPEASGTGDMLLRKPENDKPAQPTDCVRVMLQRIRACPRGKISTPEDTVRLLREMQDMDRERGMMLHLDVKNNVVGIENISTGSLSSSIVHSREALKGAILSNAANVIFVHNHPSGDPAPSNEDMAIHRQLQKAFDDVGIELLDSIIIGRDSYFSFKEHGLIGKPTGDMKIMEKNSDIGDLSKKHWPLDDDDDETCEIALSAAMSVLKEKCGQPDEEELESLERQALRLIEKTPDKSSRPGLEKQLQYYKENGDAHGMLKFIDYLRTWIE